MANLEGHVNKKILYTHIQQCYFWMILSADHKGEVPGSIQQFESCTNLIVCKAIQCQMCL